MVTMLLPKRKKNGRINMSIIFISKKNKLKYHKLSVVSEINFNKALACC